MRVEVNMDVGLPSLSVVGLPHGAVREGRDRVQAALKNSGWSFPRDRITINLAPADVKKEGSGFDLPMALGLLGVMHELPRALLASLMVLGELGLDGEIRPVRGVLPVALAAHAMGCDILVVPRANAPEARAADESLTIVPAGDLGQVVRWIQAGTPVGSELWEFFDPVHDSEQSPRSRGERVPDLSGVVGQPLGRRALEVAAAGGHNLLFSGPPGTGKTLLARALPGILPALTPDLSREVTAVHSVAGLLPAGAGLLQAPPFRAPHHGISPVGLVGGGSPLRPGEASLAHGGVLFLDELPEFDRRSLESLRQPLEDGDILVVRARERACFPSRFTLLAAMNPCPCGRFGSSEGRPCSCDPAQVRRYRGRVSGPLLDRVDLQVQVDPVAASKIIEGRKGESSGRVRERVEGARERQRARGTGRDRLNARLPAEQLPHAALPRENALTLLREASEKFRISPRGIHRVIRVARTIADLDGSNRVESEHLAEALQFRVDPALPVPSDI